MVCTAKPAFRWLLAIAAIAFSTCHAWGQSAYSPPFWEVRSGNNVVYLFGTIHVGKADFYPLPSRVDSAFRDSNVLALEADPANQQEAVTAIMSAMYTPPDNIENHLAPALLSSVAEVSAGYGLPFEQIRQMKPYLLMFTLTALEYERLGYSAAQGLENHLSQRARSDGKRVVALESMLGQMQMLDNLSPKLQTEMLQITVDEIANAEVAGLVGAMIEAWRTGKVGTLEEVLTVEERRLPDGLANEFHQRFLTERNVNMAQQVERMLATGERAFVAVGAMHMVGDGGIPAILAERGYQVTPLH
ncbi:MAG: TraB/GumN family protein [Betaproteobacteria bacterium]|nr:MAG: TraB/GumN family protein [Betaproteobacteria bacterium]